MRLFTRSRSPVGRDQIFFHVVSELFYAFQRRLPGMRNGSGRVWFFATAIIRRVLAALCAAAFAASSATAVALYRSVEFGWCQIVMPTLPNPPRMLA